jgi:hypothetical protein
VLDRLLDTLAGGGVYTPGKLARRLGVSEALVKHMLVDLSHMGYLRSVSEAGCQPTPDDAPACTNCALSTACAVRGPSGQVWTLADKRAHEPK